MTQEENKVDIEVNKANILGLKEISDKIYIQVSNHLPTAIKELREDMIRRDREQETKINGMAIKVSALMGLITFLAQKFIK